MAKNQKRQLHEHTQQLYTHTGEEATPRCCDHYMLGEWEVENASDRIAENGFKTTKKLLFMEEEDYGCAQVVALPVAFPTPY